MRLTLTLNRQWFDLIASGEKKVEYRKNTIFYKRLFREPTKWTEIAFHFYRKERLICRVVSIKKIRRPKQFKNSTYLTTPWVWAITLTDPWCTDSDTLRAASLAAKSVARRFDQI